MRRLVTRKNQEPRSKQTPEAERQSFGLKKEVDMRSRTRRHTIEMGWCESDLFLDSFGPVSSCHCLCVDIIAAVCRRIITRVGNAQRLAIAALSHDCSSSDCVIFRQGKHERKVSHSCILQGGGMSQEAALDWKDQGRALHQPRHAHDRLVVTQHARSPSYLLSLERSSLATWASQQAA